MYEDNIERTFAIRVCWLIMTIGRDVVRDTLDKIYPQGSGPGTLQEKLNRSSTVSRLNSIRAFNTADMNKLYPVSGTGCSADFDISLLIKLLRNICSLRKPNNGWDSLPNPPDISVEDDLARLKYYRNQIAHNERFLLSEKEFDECWDELSAAIVRIGGVSKKKAISKLLTEPLTEEAMETKSELYLWYLKESDINMRFNVQLEKLEVMCNKMEENDSNKELFSEVRNQYITLIDENSKNAEAMSVEQQLIHREQKEAVEHLGERLNIIEKSMRKDKNNGNTLVIWHVLTSSIFVGLGLMFYNPNYIQTSALCVLVITGIVIWYIFTRRGSPESVPHKPPLRSLIQNFVGRDEDIQKILEYLQNKNIGVVTVKAPYGYGTSELAIAVGHRIGSPVVYVDMRDIGQSVSAKILTLLGLIPLPDANAQLISSCSNLKNTLLIFDNVDYISRKEHLKADFETSLRILTDRALCKDFSILCTTQQSFGILNELGIIYTLGALDFSNSTLLLKMLVPVLSNEDANCLAEASLGIPLAVHLISDLLKSGHKPEEIVRGIKDDISNIERITELEENKKLVAITRQWMRQQDSEVQTALKTLAFVFEGSFDSLSAKAVISGTDFMKQHLLSQLTGSSFFSFDNLQNRFSIHPLYKTLLGYEVITDEAKHNAVGQYVEHFVGLVHKASCIWFSISSDTARKLLMTEQHNILHMLDMVITGSEQIVGKSTFWLTVDMLNVNTLTDFFKPTIVAAFYQRMPQVSVLNGENSSEIKRIVNICIVHVYMRNELYEEAERFMKTDSEVEPLETYVGEHKQKISLLQISLLHDESRLFLHRDELHESAKSLKLSCMSLSSLISLDDNDLFLHLGENLAEISYLFYKYYHNIFMKYKDFSKENDILWVEGMRRVEEVKFLCNHLKETVLPFAYKSPIETIEWSDFCKSSDIQTCLRHVLTFATEAQSISLSVFVHLLGDYHIMSGFRYDRLAFLLHNLEYYEKSVAYRQKAIEIRQKVLGDLHPDVAWSYYGLGNSLEELGQLDDALIAYNNCLEIRRSYLGNHYLTANAYYKIGQISQKQNKIEGAINAFSKTVEIRKHINDEPESVARALHAYGDLLMSTGNEALQKDAIKVYEEERRFRWSKTHTEAMKRLDLDESEQTDQGSQGWGQATFGSDDDEEQEQKPYYWIRMQVSNQGRVLDHGFAPGSSEEYDRDVFYA